MTNLIITTATELENLIQQSVRKALSEQEHHTQNSPQEVFLSITEAARYLKLAKQTIYGYTSKNLIPFIKKGKKVLFKQSDLETWLNQGKQKSISEITAELDRKEGRYER